MGLWQTQAGKIAPKLRKSVVTPAGMASFENAV